MASTHSPGGWRAALAMLAAANLVAGVVLSLSPSHAADLVQVVRWANGWAHGFDPYAWPEASVDYPPWALVLLSPLAAIPSGALLVTWIVVNLGLVVWTIARLVGWASEPRPQLVLLGLVIACAASFRTLSQFSVLAFVLALAGAASRSDAAGGVMLGLSLFKPQIGGALALWIWLRGQRRRVPIALAVVLLLLMAFSLRVGIGPATVVREYAASLVRTYSDLSSIPGHTDLRSALVEFAPGVDFGWPLSVLLVGLLLVPLAIGWWRTGGALARRDLEIAAFCGVVSLLAVRHLSYDLLLLLPLIVAWRVPPFTDRGQDTSQGSGPGWRQPGLIPSVRSKTVVFWSLTALLVIEVPSWYRRVIEPAGLTGLWWLTELDRALCVGVWVALAWRFVVDSERSTTDEGTTWPTRTRH